MPRIRCHYIDCVFLEDGYCGAAAIELDPDEGCLTYTRIDEVPQDEDWVEEDLDGLWEEEDEGLYEEDEDLEDEGWYEDEEV